MHMLAFNALFTLMTLSATKSDQHVAKTFLQTWSQGHKFQGQGQGQRGQGQGQGQGLDLQGQGQGQGLGLQGQGQGQGLDRQGQGLGPSPTYKVKAKEGIHSTLHHTHYSRII